MNIGHIITQVGAILAGIPFDLELCEGCEVKREHCQCDANMKALREVRGVHAIK